MQRCIDIYERGDTMLGVTGLHRLSLFDERISSDKQKRLNNSFVCMKLELPVSTFPDAVLLNVAISYKSNIPQSYSFTAEARRASTRHVDACGEGVCYSQLLARYAFMTAATSSLKSSIGCAAVLMAEALGCGLPLAFLS